MINLYDKLSKRLLESDMNPEVNELNSLEIKLVQVRAISKRVRTLEREPEMYQEGYDYVFDHLKSTVNNVTDSDLDKYISIWDAIRKNRHINWFKSG